jgi:hypothetical protein
MVRKKYTEEYIIAVLKESEDGAKTGGTLSQIRDERRHLLQLESQIGRPFRQRTQDLRSVEDEG